MEMNLKKAARRAVSFDTSQLLLLYYSTLDVPREENQAAGWPLADRQGLSGHAAYHAT